MNADTYTSTIRQRGQLTIPDEIREKLSWIRPNSPISISIVKPDEIVIKPHQTLVDWDKIWKGIKKTRSYKGKGRILPAWKFLELDRKSH